MEERVGALKPDLKSPMTLISNTPLATLRRGMQYEREKEIVLDVNNV